MKQFVAVFPVTSPQLFQEANCLATWSVHIVNKDFPATGQVPSTHFDAWWHPFMFCTLSTMSNVWSIKCSSIWAFSGRHSKNTINIQVLIPNLVSESHLSGLPKHLKWTPQQVLRKLSLFNLRLLKQPTVSREPVFIKSLVEPPLAGTVQKKTGPNTPNLQANMNL